VCTCMCVLGVDKKVEGEEEEMFKKQKVCDPKFFMKIFETHLALSLLSLHATLPSRNVSFA
jgi:hypothetical protein